LGLLGAGARLPVPADILVDSANPTTFHRSVEAIGALAFSPAADPRLVALSINRMAEVRPSVLNGDFLACDAFDTSDQLRRLRLPTLIVCGAEDKFTPPRYSQLLAGLIPQARLEIVLQAGHMVMLEQPQIVADLLSQFIESIPYIAG
jgi:pimeloyl-ACP methyl ester carboxylesterase